MKVTGMYGTLHHCVGCSKFKVQTTSLLFFFEFVKCTRVAIKTQLEKDKTTKQTWQIGSVVTESLTHFQTCSQKKNILYRSTYMDKNKQATNTSQI